MSPYSLHPDSIRKLFDNIAASYDFLNHLLSLRRDVYWRKMAVRELKGVGGWVLDIATGTAEVAIEMIQQNGHPKKVFGLDFSEPMIRRAQQKILKKGLCQSIALSRGDATALPFRENVFSASIIAFGLRNILDKEQALSEMIRVLKKGGKVIVLEFTFPSGEWVGRWYGLYFKKFLPWFGGVISGDRGAYAYLPESVSQFPDAKDYEGMLKRSGLQQIRSRKLTLGIVSIISGIKRPL
ncbi:MAG: bifunctional demethylmenaquinone methyltransferase/2-methoxy-6-polyprenyl-1,4-benzoquinol methylase UbiE [Thermodesulfobacteriota bacterium]